MAPEDTREVEPGTETESAAEAGPAAEVEAGEASGFEGALEELEEILRALEGDELRLDEALELFERGVARLRVANRLLERARGSVEELIRDASGDLRTVSFSDEDEAADGSPGTTGPPDAAR